VTTSKLHTFEISGTGKRVLECSLYCVPTASKVTTLQSERNVSLLFNNYNNNTNRAATDLKILLKITIITFKQFLHCRQARTLHIHLITIYNYAISARV